VQANVSRRAYESERQTTLSGSAVDQPARAEDTRANPAEATRRRAEADRAVAELRRDAAERDRAHADKRREDAEESRQVAEEIRASADVLREHREAARQAAEALREVTEAVRRETEALRRTHEQLRADHEALCARAEDARRATEEVKTLDTAPGRIALSALSNATDTEAATAALRRELAAIQQSTMEQRQVSAEMRHSMRTLRAKETDADVPRVSGRRVEGQPRRRRSNADEA